MEVSREEILHIANLASLNLDENEIDKYILNLQDILNFANIVNNAPIEGLSETIGATENYNVFRKDEVKEYKDVEGLLQNAPEQDENMFKIPKVDMIIAPINHRAIRKNIIKKTPLPLVKNMRTMKSPIQRISE